MLKTRVIQLPMTEVQTAFCGVKTKMALYARVSDTCGAYVIATWRLGLRAILVPPNSQCY